MNNQKKIVCANTGDEARGCMRFMLGDHVFHVAYSTDTDDVEVFFGGNLADLKVLDKED